MGFPESASSFASDIDFVILLIGAITGFWALATFGVFFWLLAKFKKQPGQKAMYIEGATKNEKKWVSRPHLAILVCDVVIIIFAIKVWYTVKQDLPEPDAVVRITAQQWAWSFQHPGPDGKLDTDDDVTVNDELHVVKDKTYHFKLTSRDVLHNFSVPVFRLRQDAIPGREITGWFKPTVAGEWDIQCAEMCGIGHGLMPARIFIDDEATHQKWLASQK